MFSFRITISSWHVTQATQYESSTSEPNCTYLRLLLRTSYDIRYDSWFWHHSHCWWKKFGQPVEIGESITIYRVSYIPGGDRTGFLNHQQNAHGFPSCRCLHWSNRFHLEWRVPGDLLVDILYVWGQPQVTNSWCLDFEGAMSCTKQNGNLQYAGVFKCYPFCRDQPMQINGDFEGFPL